MCFTDRNPARGRGSNPPLLPLLLGQLALQGVLPARVRFPHRFTLRGVAKKSASMALPLVLLLTFGVLLLLLLILRVPTVLYTPDIRVLLLYVL